MLERPRWALENDRMTGRANRIPVGASRAADGTLIFGRVLFALLLMFFALLQSSFLPATGLMGVVPDFALVFLLIWSSARGTPEGLIWAFGLGLWLDLLTLDPLGTHAIALLAVAAMGGAVRGRLFRSGAILPILAVIIATLAYGMLLIVVHLLQGVHVDVSGAMRLALLNALLNALLVPLAYGVLLMFERWVPRRVS